MRVALARLALALSGAARPTGYGFFKPISRLFLSKLTAPLFPKIFKPILNYKKKPKNINKILAYNILKSCWFDIKFNNIFSSFYNNFTLQFGGI